MSANDIILTHSKPDHQQDKSNNTAGPWSSFSTIPSAGPAFEHESGWDAAAIVRQPQHSHDVDEHGGEIDVPAVFAGGVVVGKDVVVVVEALAYGAERHAQVLGGVDVAVVGLVAPHVGGTVDQPGGVETQGVA